MRGCGIGLLDIRLRSRCFERGSRMHDERTSLFDDCERRFFEFTEHVMK
jgi:hypothetical protein